MRFKHLALQGYKSFATKTEFLFPTGITAIVGPNGSGKSNIADGIRWVLGEQRISSLRGKSTADMIYAGGRRRARAGMAEVSLTLDNSDDWLPIEFSEVTITRRAYRSGENEYLLNSSKVRLRDIGELLAAGGLSQSAYTVIGQGLVDTALSLRPQERRDLFEEAAGISAYRGRREDALSRLEETQHNLERAYDIIGEITPRLRRLEREVARVEESRRLTAHLERLQRTWYGYQWGRRQDTLAQALEKASYLEADLEKHQADASALSEKLVHQRQRESRLRTLLRDWYRDSADLLDRVNEARRELAVTEERARLLSTRRKELLTELEPLNNQVKTQVEQVNKVRAQADHLEQEMAARNEQLEAQELAWKAAQAQAQEPIRQRDRAEQELRAHRIQLEQLNQALVDARADEAHLASERAVAEERARQLQARREKVLAEFAPLANQEETQSKQIAQAQAQVEQLEHELTERKTQLAELERHWEAKQQQAQMPDLATVQAEHALRDRRAEMKQLDQDLLDARAEKARLTGELEALNRMHDASTSYDSGVETLLQANLDGILKRLSAFVQVPAEWERAIEAALGPDLHAVVVERASVAIDAHKILASSGGRAILLPLDDLVPSPLLPAEAHRAGVTRAADVVTCEAHIRPAVETLLGCVALCSDLQTAQTLLPAMPPGSCCATSDGIVLRTEGIISLGMIKVGGVLANERAWREIPTQLEIARQNCLEIENRQKTAGEKIAVLESRLEELTQKAAAVREEAARIEREKAGEARTEVAVTEEALRNQRATLRREEVALDQLRAQKANLRRQAEQLEAEYATTIDHIHELSSEAAAQMSAVSQQSPSSQIETIQRRCQQIEEELQAKAEKSAVLEKRLEELSRQAKAASEKAAQVEREALGQARTQLAVAEEALRSQQTTLRREETLLERLQAQLSARQQRIEELDAEHTAVLARTERLHAEVAQAEAQLNQAREHIQPTEDELTQLGEEQTALELQEQQARQRAREAEARYGRAQLEVDRCQDELNLLSRQIEEDLGLVELELADSVTAQTPLPLHPVVSELPIVEELPEGLREEIQRLKARLRRIGGVNPVAPEDYQEVKERHQFLTEQSADLEIASERLQQVIAELDELMKVAFQKTFDAVAERFTETFTTLFNGGAARLELTEPDDLMNTGVDIVAQPPGKRAQRLALLSGGERSLTAVALLFAILQVSPAPFCVLDEVDAALDEANVGRFRNLLTDLAQKTQFIVITHNRGTIEVADTIYGVSMGVDGMSQVVSLKMD